MELSALALFAFITSITPGPNTLMLASSGMNFGVKRSLPHAFGVSAGFVTLIALSACGVGTLLLGIPGVKHLLAAFGSVYLLYLLWKLNLPNTQQQAGAPPSDAAASNNLRPLFWWQSASFQFANPKAWLMAVMGVALFLPAPEWGWHELGLLCVIFFAINLLTGSAWIFFGTAMQRTLLHPGARAWCYTVLVALTLYTIAGLWLW